MSILRSTYIKTVSSWNSGGGITMDIVELKDGRVLGITDESVILYSNMEALEGGESLAEAGMIILSQ